MVKTSGGKSKRGTRKKMSTRQMSTRQMSTRQMSTKQQSRKQQSIKQRPQKEAFIHTKNSVIQTIDYGEQPLLSIKTVGGAILDDIKFKSALSAFEYFLTHSKPTLLNTNSISGRIIQLDLNKGIKSPYTSYNRNTFLHLNTGDIKTLIVKFVLIGDRKKTITLSDNHLSMNQYLEVVTRDELEHEYTLQNYIACKTANDDPNNKYLMATPYNIYSNYNNITNELSDKFLIFLRDNKADKIWPNFYKLAKNNFHIGIIAMTKAKGIIGYKVQDKDKYLINEYKLQPELAQQYLSSSSPTKGVINSPNIHTLLVKYLERNKKTLLQRTGLQKYTMSEQDKEYTKILLKMYSPYISIIYTLLRIAVYSGYIHKDLHGDNYFITSENTDYFSLDRTIIIDWGRVYFIPHKDRAVYLELWNKEEFRKLLEQVLNVLSNFNKPTRPNNTFKTLSDDYRKTLGEANTEILLKLYHNQCKARNHYYNNKINRLWSSLDNTLYILDLETYLQTVEEKFKAKIPNKISMHTNLVLQNKLKTEQKYQSKNKSSQTNINQVIDDILSKTLQSNFISTTKLKSPKRLISPKQPISPKYPKSSRTLKARTI